MFDKPFTLSIITPTRVVYNDQALSVSAPGVSGGFQVLYNHAPLLAALEVGEMKVRTKEGAELHYAVGGGFVEVKNNSVVVLADSAELASEIDRGRAEEARTRASGRIHTGGPGIDIERAEFALRRAINRLRVASRP
jgi:F-type H+-transporting ATPase subunit epsilon